MNRPAALASIIHELHVVKYSFTALPQPEINITLDVTAPGMYSLSIPEGLIMKQNWYQISSMDENLLRVCRYKFMEEHRNITKI